MALIIDTGPLVALADAADGRHRSVRTFLEGTDEALFLSPFVLAEVDHFVTRDLGVGAEIKLLDDVSRGVLTLEPIDPSDVARCSEVVHRYRDLDVGLADASIVVLAERHRTDRVLTFDERHFRAMRTLSGLPFVILPEDPKTRRHGRR